jgi:hypothetical protein
MAYRVRILTENDSRRAKLERHVWDRDAEARVAESTVIKWLAAQEKGR